MGYDIRMKDIGTVRTDSFRRARRWRDVAGIRGSLAKGRLSRASLHRQETLPIDANLHVCLSYVCEKIK